MKFLYDKNAGEERLKIVNEAFLHLKARRVEAGERISVKIYVMAKSISTRSMR
ncbi:hypothetical protein VB002_07045 [Campylobacter concisus]